MELRKYFQKGSKMRDRKLKKWIRQRVNQINEPYVKVCDYCGNEFKTQLHSQKRCSPECSRAARLEWQRLYAEQMKLDREVYG